MTTQTLVYKAMSDAEPGKEVRIWHKYCLPSHFSLYCRFQCAMVPDPTQNTCFILDFFTKAIQMISQLFILVRGLLLRVLQYWNNIVHRSGFHESRRRRPCLSPFQPRNPNVCCNSSQLQKKLMFIHRKGEFAVNQSGELDPKTLAFARIVNLSKGSDFKGNKILINKARTEQTNHYLSHPEQCATLADAGVTPVSKQHDAATFTFLTVKFAHSMRTL